MTKENVRDFLPLVQALAEGKTIQHYEECRHTWEDCDNPHFDDDVNTYRIKPEVEYIPFDTVDELIECWNRKKYKGKLSYNTELEMPMIWVRETGTKIKLLITHFQDAYECVYLNDIKYSMKDLFEHLTFLDGTPIGKIKE